VEIEISVAYPRRKKAGVYRDPPPWPNIENIRDIRKTEMMAARSVKSMVDPPHCTPFKASSLDSVNPEQGMHTGLPSRVRT